MKSMEERERQVVTNTFKKITNPGMMKEGIGGRGVGVYKKEGEGMKSIEEGEGMKERV